MPDFHFLAPPPLSLYIHIPWCARKCPYCDFNSHTARGDIPEQDYVAALLRDLEQDIAAMPAGSGPSAGSGIGISTVFIGGGTPSLFSPDSIAALLAGIRARVLLAQDAEITLEANPGTVDAARFRSFYQAGINRLSLGIQSFDDALLARIGRIHDSQQARQAIEQARAAGFENLNLDLMFGLPGQTLESALADLCQAIALQPAHLSWYQLTLEPNTPFHRQPPILPDDDALWAMQQAGQALLAEAGYAQYEISAYTRPGQRCRHNLNYWEFGDYLGIGAGAHGKLSRPNGIRRTAKPRHPRAYLRGDPPELTELTPADASLEFMLNALRLCHGFAPGLFGARTGLPLETVEKPLREAAQRGWLAWEAQRICPTGEGLRFLNDMLELFMV